jgi:hypothetical protein
MKLPVAEILLSECRFDTGITPGQCNISGRSAVVAWMAPQHDLMT